MTTDVTEALTRSNVSLDSIVRDALQQGRTLRSRNRDGEYAIVLTDNSIFEKGFDCFDCVAGVADDRADWTIAVPDFTLRNVAESEPDLLFWAPVLDRAGVRIGTIAVNGSPYGNITTDQGPVRTATAFFSTLQAGELFVEPEVNREGYPIVFRATADADSNGRVAAVVVSIDEERVFDLGPDYMAFKVV